MGTQMTTPHEQLAKIVADERDCYDPCPDCHRIADAIITAGWQPPIPDRLNVVSEN